MATSVMDSKVRVPDEPEAHAVPLFSLRFPLSPSAPHQFDFFDFSAKT